MPRFEPFAALRYTAAVLDDVIAPPYDVLSVDDRAAARRTRRAQHRARRRAGRRRRPVRAGGGHACRLGGRRHTHPRRRTDVHAVPHALRRRHRSRAPPRRRARRARGGRRGRGRRAAPRAHHPEGVDRSSRPDAGDESQPLAGVGTVARHGVDRGPRRAGRAGGRGHRRRRGAHGRAGDRPGAAGRDLPVRGGERRAHRRRPPPLRRRAGLPRRAAPRSRIRQRGRRADVGVRG